MKRLLPLILAVCLLLCACGNAPADNTSDTADETTTETTLEETTTETTKAPILYRHPLTGLPLEAPFAGRPVAVVINNLKAALPHHGVSTADWFYEVETEGGITRCLAVYTDLAGNPKVGPVRSARTFFNNIAVSYDAPIVHCGGSVRGRNAGYGDSSDKIDGWEHLDQVYNGKYFFRDEDRYNNKGYNWEHTLFATGDNLLKGIADKGYDTPAELDYGLQFADDQDLLPGGGFVANSVTVTFKGDKTSSFRYDDLDMLYKMSQYGDIYIDANTGEQMAFKNVMVLYTEQWKRHDGEYSRSYYELEGEGEGYLATNGEIVKIKWSRKSLRDPFVYTLEDGSPVTFGVGKTYVAIASETSTPIDYQ